MLTSPRRSCSVRVSTSSRITVRVVASSKVSAPAGLVFIGLA